MLTSAIFSEDYYNRFLLLDKGFLSKRQSDPTEVEVVIGGFWNYRDTHATVNQEGTITTVSFSLFENMLRYFSFSQNQDLIAVHKKLKELEGKLDDPSSSELQTLIREIHDKKLSGANKLMHHLIVLNDCFEKGNRASEYAQTFLKVVNFFLGFFHLEPIQHYYYEAIDLKKFNEKVIEPALRLTPSEQLTVTHKNLPTIEFKASFSISEDLNQQNIAALISELKDRIDFDLEGKKFHLTYNKENKHFIFSYFHDENAPSLTNVSPKEKDFNYKSDPLFITEKASSKFPSLHRLQFSIKQNKEKGWFDLNTNAKLTVEPGQLVLNPGSEYRISLSKEKNFQMRVLAESP